MSRLSLRVRLLLLTIALLAAGLVTGGVVTATALEDYLVRRVDGQLRPIADVVAVAPGLAWDTPSTGPQRRELTEPAADFLGHPYLAYVAPDGTVTEEVLFTPDRDAPRPRLPRLDRAAVVALDGRAVDVPSRAGEQRWRMIALPYAATGADAAGPPAGGTVVVAASRADVDATIAQLRTIFLLTGGALLVALGVAGWFAVRAGLRPLRRIEDTATAIAGGDLTRRIPELASPGTEVGRLSAALNGMLGQLESAFAARENSEATMRRFVADVSHELRTPLFSIKGFAELYLMGGLPEPADVDRTMRRIDAEAGRLATLTEDLLLLARLDNPAAHDGPPLETGPTDLRTLAADAAHDLRALDASRPVRLTGPGDEPHATAAPMLGDEARLRQVVVNLVGNVAAHTPPGTPARIGVGTVAGEAVFEIADAGPGLTPEDAERVFDRFYRVDASRSRNGGTGAGLGLAIVRSLVLAHGGRAELSTAPGAGTTFRLAFPALGDAGPDRLQ